MNTYDTVLIARIRTLGRTGPRVCPVSFHALSQPLQHALAQLGERVQRRLQAVGVELEREVIWALLLDALGLGGEVPAPDPEESRSPLARIG